MTMANQKKQYLYVNRAQILSHFTPTPKKTYMVDTSWWRSFNDHTELGALTLWLALCGLSVRAEFLVPLLSATPDSQIKDLNLWPGQS